MTQILATIKKWFSKQDKYIDPNEVKWLEHQRKENEELLEKQKKIKALIADIDSWNTIKDDKDKSYEFLYKYSSLFEEATIMPTVSIYKMDNLRYCMDNPDKIVYKEINTREFPGYCLCGKVMGCRH